MLNPETTTSHFLSAADGVPFFWAETKPVDWFSNFFRDLEFNDVFDCTVGSCAAAIGAYYAGVQYDRICCNPLHKTWAEQHIMEKAMFAVIADGGASFDQDTIGKIVHYFGPTIDEGMRFIRADVEDSQMDGGSVGEDVPGVGTHPSHPNEDDNSDGFEE